MSTRNFTRLLATVKEESLETSKGTEFAKCLALLELIDPQTNKFKNSFYAFTKAKILIKMMQPEKAIDFLRPYVSANLQDVNLLFILSHSYFASMQYDEALMVIDKTIKVNPLDSWLYIVK